jgi:uncharacterized protein
VPGRRFAHRELRVPLHHDRDENCFEDWELARMRVAITGATGLIGRRLIAALLARGDEVTVVTRSPSSAMSLAGTAAVEWNPGGARPPDLSGQDAVVHLAGEPIAQRWTSEVKDRIRSSRIAGTETVVAALRASDPRPRVLVSTSAAGYYGDRGSELLEETAPPGPPSDFLASVCVGWEGAANGAADLGVRVVIARNGVVLGRGGGALAKMLPPFKAGLGGPIAGGEQYVPWIALDDVVGIYLAALDGSESWSGAVNAAAPGAVTNGDFTKALGRVLQRPAFLPLPAFALRTLFGEMASVLLSSQRLVPARPVGLGYQFRYPELDAALVAALASS